MATESFAGPIDFVVFAFERAQTAAIGDGLHAVVEQVERGVIEILDIEVITKDAEGAATRGSISELAAEAGPSLPDFEAFEGAESGILDQDDLDGIAAELTDSQFAIAIVYEDRSLAPAAAAWIAAGGTELFSGGIDIADLETALQEGTES